MNSILEVMDLGFGASVQDLGRRGWRHFGVPPGGAMDDHAAGWANRLLDNPPSAPLIELAFQGAQLRAAKSAWIAITGADASCDFPLWKVVRIREGDLIRFPHNHAGFWTYIGIEGGFQSELFFGSASAYARGGIGRALAKGEMLSRQNKTRFAFQQRVAGRFVQPAELRDYLATPKLKVWRGPQWASFPESAIKAFFACKWQIGSQCDRVEYQLEGAAIHCQPNQIVSEPVRVGSIQIPENGQPIVAMRDGPTVGGYPKIGIIDPADLSRLAQCRPGDLVQFEEITLPPPKS